MLSTKEHDQVVSVLGTPDELTPLGQTVVRVAETKLAFGFGDAFVRGIFCNELVMPPVFGLPSTKLSSAADRLRFLYLSRQDDRIGRIKLIDNQRLYPVYPVNPVEITMRGLACNAGRVSV